jgi:integrase/recombinase XerD
MINNTKDIHINQAISDYLNWKNTHTTKAYKAYKKRLKDFATFILNIHPDGLLSQIDGQDVVAFHQSMKSEFSDATISYSARILKNFFDFYRGRGVSTLNPKEIRGVRFVYKQKTPVDQEDIEKMLSGLDTAYIDQLQKALVIRLLWDTGMRLAELLSLKLEDLTSQDDNGLRCAKLRTLKTFRYNIVVWGRQTNDLLNTYLGWRLSVEPENPFLLIPSRKQRKNNVHISPRTIQRWIKDISAKELNGKAVSPHCFRHGRAHHIINNNGSPLDVQAILRHKNLNSSLNYMQLNPSQYLKTASKYLDSTKEENLTRGFQIVPTSWAA